MNKQVEGSKICPKCGTKHNKEGIYCGYKCSNGRKHSEETKRKISNSLKGKPCNRHSYGPLSNLHKKSIKQGLNKYWNNIKNNIKKNNTFENWPEHYRREHMYKKVNYSCQQCGFNKTDFQGNAPLEIHHIDGNHNNNKENNLQVLCRNCHFLTDNYGHKKKNYHTEKSKKLIQKNVDKNATKNFLKKYL